ncbi:MAG: Ppx/GppA family phosphatase, partial [Alphaproteobacteria bacterium]
AGGGTFFAVGGAWRALARLHKAQTEYPLRVLHHYRLAADDADELCGLVVRMGRQSLRRIAAVSRNRLAALPWAALVLQRVIRIAAPQAIVFSANGLREGVLFDSLSAAERRRDPLIAACTDAARGRDRFGDHAAALYRFSAGAFPDDDGRTGRLRRAAAILSDLAWREHPEHRAKFALEAALYLPDGCLTHDERAWLALALHALYGGAEDAPIAAMPRGLLAAEGARRARATGLCFRLGYALGGAVAGTLRHAALARQGDRLELRAGPRLAPLLGELIDRRLRTLADALGLTPVVVPSKAPRPLAAATR